MDSQNRGFLRPWLQPTLMPLQTVSQDQLQQHYRFQRPTVVMSQSFPSVSVMPITPNSEIQMQAQYSQAFRKSSISPRKAQVEKENQAPPSSRFTKDETKLLVNLWEDEFEAFLNKKRVKQEDWDALTEMYNSHAVVMKLSRRTSTQLENKIKNLRDGYKKISDSLKTTGSGFDRDSMWKDFPFWDTFDRLYRDRDSFNPKHILNLQQAKSKKANTDQSYTEAQDQFYSSDEVSEDDTLALAAKRRISTYGKTNASSNGTKRKASEESPASPSVPSKRKPQDKKITVAQLQEQEKDAEDRVLQFLVESREKDQEIFGKLMQFAEQADKRNSDITLKLMEALGSASRRKTD